MHHRLRTVAREGVDGARKAGRPASHYVAETTAVTFTQLDPAVDVEPLVAFLAANTFPFHCQPRMTVGQAREDNLVMRATFRGAVG